MATWRAENSMLTQRGVEILNKLKAGVGSITVTRIVAGSGRVTESLLYPLTEVKGVQKEMTVSNVNTSSDGSEISFYITNDNFTESYDLHQLGVYVTHPDYEGEQLYHISQCDADDFDTIPAMGETPVSQGYSIFMEHGNSSAINLTVDPQGMVRKDEFNETLKGYSKGLYSNQTYYVSTDGNDETGDGSESSPFATVQKAIDLLPSNLNGKRVKILLKSGEYNKFQIHHKYNGHIEIEGPSIQDKARIKGDCVITYSTGRVKLTNLHFTTDFSNNTAILEVQTAQEIMVNQCTFDSLTNTLSGIGVMTGCVSLGATRVVFNNCKHCINTNHDSGIGGVSTVSVYSCTGSNNFNGFVNNFSTISVHNTTKETLGATTLFNLMVTAGPTYVDGVALTSAVAPSSLE